jgi:hypothetical protein
VDHLGQVVEVRGLSIHCRRGAPRPARLDLVVVDDAALGGVDQEHAPGLEPALAHDAAWSIGSVPTSEAMTTRPSSQTQ